MSWQGNWGFGGRRKSFQQRQGDAGEPGNSFLHCAAHWPTGGAQKRPISSGPAPGSCLLLESLPTPATIQAYWVPAPTRWPTFCILLLGGSGEESLPVLSLMLLAGSWRKWLTSSANSGGSPRSNSRKGGSAPSSSPGEGYVQENRQGCLQQNPAAPPILPLGPSPLTVAILRLGTGTQLASSDWSAQPFYSFFQGSHGC